MIAETIIKWSITAILGGACTVITFIVKKYFDKFLKKIDGIDIKVDDLSATVKTNDLAILWSQLKSKTDDILKKQFCTTDDEYCLNALLKCYQDLGGNHGMESKVAQCLALPSTKKGKK